MRLTILLFLALISYQLSAQQTIRGKIIDIDSKASVPFASIQLLDSLHIIGGSGDVDGQFRLENVPLGKHNFIISCVGYETKVLSNIEVTSAKEVILEIEMQESFQQLDVVSVVANPDKGRVNNEFATISARTLRVEEAMRYAASIGDPARQALNFAGVGGGGDDLYNEIVIRGNSPRGLLWRLEGMEISNPNHFSTLGSSGGAVSMLSSNVLATSDFYTGAFPAEFGNANSGVFDLKFRKGNNENYETTVGAGFLGLEVASEGPINRETGASYLFNYRYSTLAILNQLGIDIAGDLLPSYQDLSFNINVPTKKLGTINVYGLAGNSWLEQSENEEGFEESTEDRAKLGIIGIKQVLFLSKKAFLRNVINGSMQQHEYIEKESSSNYNYQYKESTEMPSLRFSSLYNQKINARNTIQIGAILSRLQQEVLIKERENESEFVYNDFKSNTLQFQSFFQWKWRLQENLTLNSGLHYLYYDFTQQQALEPRMGLNWQYRKNASWNFGMGLHSRAEDLYVYSLQEENDEGNLIQPNKDLGLSKALHLVLGHDWNLNEHTRLKVEAYFQHLYNIPADSLNLNAINAENVFDFDNVSGLSNRGLGRNYGLEFTLERFLHQNFYYLTTLSLYQSEFKNTSEADYWNTRYNGNYIFNFLAGKEFPLGKEKNKLLGLNFKTTVFGGQRYTNLNETASLENGELIYSSTPFEGQNPTYYRIDLGISYSINLRTTTHRLSLNVQNVTNRLNEIAPEFDFSRFGNQIIRETTTQNGIIPVLKYSVDF